MATRQTAGKSSSPRRRTSAAAKPAGPAKAASTPAKAGSPARGKQPAAAEPAKPSVRDRLAAAWGGLVSRAGGGVPLTTQIVSVLGLADSIYLTYQHVSAAQAFVGCSDKGAVNCEAVTTSAWSHLFGLPVSELGLAFFVFMVIINSPWGWRTPWAAVHWARLASVIVGIVMVLYLIWAEIFRIGAICLYCTGVHVLTFVLFAVVVGKVTFSGVKPVPATR